MPSFEPSFNIVAGERMKLKFDQLPVALTRTKHIARATYLLLSLYVHAAVKLL